MSDKKDLEIVSGDDSNLDISPVYQHLNTSKPQSKKPKNIIVPKEKSDKEDKVVDDELEEESKSEDGE